MAKTELQKAYRDKWDAKNMSYQTVKVRKELLEDFRSACAASGDKVNTVLRGAMEQYVEAYYKRLHAEKDGGQAAASSLQQGEQR